MAFLLPPSFALKHTYLVQERRICDEGEAGIQMPVRCVFVVGEVLI